MGVLFSYTYKLVPHRNAEINCNIKLTGNYLERVVCFMSVALAAANQTLAVTTDLAVSSVSCCDESSWLKQK